VRQECLPSFMLPAFVLGLCATLMTELVVQTGTRIRVLVGVPGIGLTVFNPPTEG
jgi:hypothetical protein